MPVTVSYPGVYIEEIPSGVRTIVGVATSIAAFIGRARSGPVNEPVVINGIGDFERRFGGLGTDYPMGYAVRDFFLNGGGQAIVVRLYHGTGGAATFTVGGVKLRAAYPGKWGEWLRASVELVTDSEAKARLDLDPGDQLFNLTVRDTRPGGVTEQLRSLTVKKDSARRVDKVLEAESQLVRWDGDWPATLPTISDEKDKVTNMEQDESGALKTAQKALLAAKAAGKTGDDLKPFQTAVNDALKAIQDMIVAWGAADSPALVDADFLGAESDKTGIFALGKADLFNLFCIPPDTRGGDTSAAVYQAAMEYCVRRRAMLIVDPPAAWGKAKETAVAKAISGLDALGLTGVAARNAALYFPRIVESDPERRTP